MEALIKNINWKDLKEQKKILINMVQDWGESSDPQQKADAEEVEGILSLIDAIQDKAVELEYATETEVFGEQTEE